MQDLAIDVPEALVPYVAAALVRLTYLYPAVRWSFDSGTNRIIVAFEPEVTTADGLRKEAFFQIYREKIHSDTLAIRNRIYEAIAP